MDVARCLEAPETYAAELAEWVREHVGREWAPLVYATAGKEKLAYIQQRFGAEKASAAVEAVFAALAVRLAGNGCNRFIVAGGETSGSVTLVLKASAFRLGPQIAPGVPWIQSLERPLCLALKSGNFGDEQFFFKAQEMV